MEPITEAILASTERLKTLAAANDAQPMTTARDWAGFFAALASFVSTLLPLILPLFIKPEPK